MRLSRIRVAAVILLVVGLAAWTAASPPILGVQSEARLNSSLFSFAKSFATQNFTDGSGAYTFRFGFDYSANISQGEKVQLAIYCALTYQDISSPFTRGVALSLQSFSLSIDGRQNAGINTASRTQPGLQIYYIQNLNTNIPAGLHNMSARMIVSTVDVNYIGNLQGSTQVVTLKGFLNINASS